MPLPKRSIEPVHVARSVYQQDELQSVELETVTNTTLTNIIRQLSSLSKHAEDVFGELARDVGNIGDRANSLQARIDRLAIKVTQLDSTVEEVPLTDITRKKAFKSAKNFDQQIFSRATMPAPMLETYAQCDKPPPLDKLNVYRDDGKDGLKFYTDPNYFFELWRQEMLKDTERVMHDKGKKMHRPRQDGGASGRGHKKRVRTPHNTREKQRQIAIGHGETLMPNNVIYRTPNSVVNEEAGYGGSMGIYETRPARPNSIELRRSYQSEQIDGVYGPLSPQNAGNMMTNAQGGGSQYATTAYAANGMHPSQQMQQHQGMAGMQHHQQQSHLQHQQQQQQQQQTTPHQHQPHAQHPHQHQHQHAAGTTSPYKSCWCYGDSTYHMKILVPAVASGAIIGKGGETIASLQKDTGARVKMSKSHDFYPGTTERVCLITGTVEGIMTVLDFIMDKIREKPDLNTKILDAENKQSQERDKQVKILVPNSTAGMIIGKGGAYIKQIKEESGSYVQISQKPKDISLQERCITIIGDKENNKNACKMILSKIVEDPQSGTCLNVSYADVSGPVANFNPTGSPYATNQNAINSSTASLNSTLGTTIGGAASAAGLLVNGTGINLSLNLSTPNPAPNLALATQLLEHIKVALRSLGYSETATTEVCAALGVLAKYGVLGMGVGLPHANGAHTTLGSYLGVSTLDQQTAAANAAASASNVFGAVGQVNLEQYTAAAAAAAAAAASRPTQTQLDVAAAAAQFDHFRHLGSAATAGQAATPVSLNNNSFGLTAATGTATTAPTLGANAAHSLSSLSKSPTPGDLGAKDTKNVEIPEVIVGAILGPNGRSLVEIQHVSGANVQISKKGIFAPGTRNRIVTITGQPSAIAKAQFLIEQKINEEETKRARQIPLATVVN